MSTITLRSTKGSPLTNTEVDNNFTNLNNDKYQSGDNVSLGSGTFTGALTAPAEVRISNTGGNWVGYNEIGRYSFYTTDASGAGARELASIRGIAEDVGTTASGALYFYTSPYNSNVIERLRITDGGDFVFNEGSYDADFRVESDGRTHMLYVDGGTSQVSIAQSLWATNPTSTSLQIEGNLVQSNNQDYARNTFTAMSWSGECTWLAGNAYRNYSGKTSGMPLVGTGECKFLADRNQYNNSAGLLRYIGNGGTWEFYSTSITTGTDTGQDADIDWSGGKLLSMNSGSAVFNDDSADRDFRVESDAGTHALFVDAGNNRVGINTDVPTYQLSVNNPNDVWHAQFGQIGGKQLRIGGRTTNGSVIGAYNDNTNNSPASLLLQRDGGNVGIGTDNPATKLHIQDGIAQITTDGTTDARYRWKCGDGGSGWIGSPQWDANGWYLYSSNDTGGEINTVSYNGGVQDGWYFRSGTGTGNGGRLVIDASGNVIFNEGSYDADFRIESNDNANMFFVDGGNNRIGINKGNPIASLDVNGDICVSNDSQTHWVALELGNGHSSDTPYLMICKTSDTVRSLVGTITMSRTGGVSANGSAIMQVSFHVGNNTNNVNYGIETLAGSSYTHCQGSFVTCTWDDGNGADVWYAIRYQYGWSTDVNQHTFTGTAKGINFNFRPSSEISNVNELGYKSTKTFMHTNLGIGNTNPSGLLHIGNNPNSWQIFNGWLMEGGTTGGTGSSSNLYYSSSAYRFRTTGYNAAHHDLSGGMHRFRVSNGSGTAGDAATMFENLTVKSAEVVVNDQSRDVDLRVESDNYAYALFVQGSDGQIAFTKSQAGESVTTGHGWGWHPGGGAGFQSIVQTADSGNGCMYLNKRIRSSSGTNTFIQFMLNDGSSTNYYVGNITGTSTGTTYNTTSDRRVKDNIKTITDGTDKLMAMRPVTHTWKADPDAPAVHGFIAQEMQNVIPEAVSGEDGGDEMMSMDYGRITPVIVAALQDAHREIQNLKAEIAALKGDK